MSSMDSHLAHLINFRSYLCYLVGNLSECVCLMHLNAREQREERETHLVSSQDLEGGDDLVGCVRVCRFLGHEVNEGLERDGAAVVGIDDAHDAGELGVALATRERRGLTGSRAQCAISRA